MLHVEAVAGTRRVVVVLGSLADEPVVGAVVDALEAKRGPEVVALRGVVVDDVEDHLDAGLMQRAHHVPELVDLIAAVAAGGVLVVRREETDRVVAPVVAQALLDQPMVVDELVHRHELHRGHAEGREVLDDRGMGETGVCAANLLGHVRVTLRHTFHVRFVDDRFVQRRVGPAVAAPVEMGMLDDRTEHVRRAVRFVDGILVAQVVRVARRVPCDLALDRQRVRIEQELARVATNAVFGGVWTVHTVAVPLTRANARQVRMP